MSFLHGIETINVDQGARPISLVRTSVVSINGIAPKGPKDTLTVITTERQGVEVFGEQVPGFTIPQALKAHFDQGGGRVIVVNSFDSATHVTAVTDESKVITDGKAKLANAPVGSIVLTNQAGTTTYVAGTDYEVDAFGNLVVLNFTSIPEGSTVLADYSHLDGAAITSAVIIGTISGNTRTGLKLLVEAQNTFGYSPKILICPTYCEIEAVAAELIVQADALRAQCLIDAPEGTTPSDAITARGPSGTLAGFKTASKTAILCTPYVKAYDPATDATVNRPLSPYFAGVLSANPNYWESPSNKEIAGISGIEQTITAGLNDANSSANQLNEAGICTIFSGYGTGFRTWGNRSAAFPSVTTIDNFIAVNRVKNILHESVEAAMLQFIDSPINQALIDSIRASVNAFIRTLVGRGAIVDGECTYNPDDNPAVDIAAGHIKFDITFAPPTPAERITFKSHLDINLLAALV